MAYTPRLPDYEHQTRAKLKARGKEAFGFLLEYGTGKTKISLDEFGELAYEKELDDLLIIAPSGMYNNWSEDSPEKISQITEHLDPELRSRLHVATWKSGNKSSERAVAELLANKDPRRPRALVMNIEALSRVDRAVSACQEFLLGKRGNGGRAYMLVDESTTAKSMKAQRTQNVIDIGKKARVRRILTGLITPRSPLDLFAQFEYLDWKILGFHTYRSFVARYAITKTAEFGSWEDHQKKARGEENDLRTVRNVIVGYRHVEELQQKIAPHSFRALKSECLQLPEKVYLVRQVEHTPQQKRMYAEIREFATAQIEGEAYVTPLSVIAQMLRLHQINCGWVVDDEKIERDVESNRLRELLAVLDEHGGKAIIWAHYNRAVSQICEALKREYGPGSVAAYWGGNKTTRGEDEKRWLSDKECRFMVASQGAGARGNTWIQASLVIYYANNHDLELRLSSEDRAHRAGLKHSVTYVDLMTRGTVDEKMVQSFRKKIDMASLITGDTYKSWLI